jgi:hypothetical protein
MHGSIQLGADTVPLANLPASVLRRVGLTGLANHLEKQKYGYGHTEGTHRVVKNHEQRENALDSQSPTPHSIWLVEQLVMHEYAREPKLGARRIVEYIRNTIKEELIRITQEHPGGIIYGDSEGQIMWATDTKQIEEKDTFAIGSSFFGAQYTFTTSYEAPAPASAPPRPGLLIGRDEDLKNLKNRMQSRVITNIRGWPGVGMTALAAALAHDPDTHNDVGLDCEMIFCATIQL